MLLIMAGNSARTATKKAATISVATDVVILYFIGRIERILARGLTSQRTACKD